MATTTTLTPVRGTGSEITMTDEEFGQRYNDALVRGRARLEERIATLEAKLGEMESWNRAALRDIKRLKAAVKAAGGKMPVIGTEQPLSGTPYVLRRPTNQKVRSAVLARDGVWCRYCGVETTQETRRIDHVHPASLGGRETLDNLVVACRTCNYRKGSRIPEEVGMVLRPVPVAEG